MTENTPLAVEEHKLISRELAKKSSHRSIAKVLGRHHSVISREIHRNGGGDHYRAVVAEERAATIRRRPKLQKLEADQRLHDFVQYGLAPNGHRSRSAVNWWNNARMIWICACP